MKKIMILFVSLCLIFVPCGVDASSKKDIKSLNLEETLRDEGIEPTFTEYKEDDTQATIYFFRSKGESRGVEFLNYLNSIYEEYGQFFKLVSYDVENEANLELMNNVIDHMNSSVTTVPFIIIGDVHFTTYEESVNENILKAIIQDYHSEVKIDNIDEVLTKYYRNYNLMIGIIIVLVLGFVGLMIYASMKENKNSD